MSDLKAPAWQVACRVLVIASLVFALARSTHGADYAIESFAEPNIKLDLAANEPGVLDKLLVKEGQKVSAGELVGSLDVEVLQAQQDVFDFRSKSTGARDSALAELEVRKQRLDALQELDTRGHANKAELLRAEADYRIAKAGLQNVLDEQKVMQLEVERIGRQIHRRQIFSPIDGVVVKIHKELGESIPMNGPEVITIAQLNPLRIHFPVSAVDSIKLKNGQEVTIHFPEFKGTRVGKVELVSPVMDPKSSTVNVTVLVPNEEQPVIPGTRCVLVLESRVTPASSESTPLAGKSTPASPQAEASPATRKASVTSSRFSWPFTGNEKAE